MSGRCVRWLPVALGLVAVAACGPDVPAEAQIQSRIEHMADALADRDAGEFMAPVAEDFSGVNWNLDRRSARMLLRREMLAHERLRARVFDFEIELQGSDRATAVFQAVLTGGSGLIPETGRWYRVTSGWRLEGNDWMLISARWEPVAGN